MIKNYLKIAFRNLAKHKGYSFINITGLALGIACCLLIFMYVKDELTFDRYHTNSDRIYRIVCEIEFGGNTSIMGATNDVEAKEYAERLPEIEYFTRFSETGAIVKKGDEFIYQYGTVFSDPSVFKMFDFKVLSGALDGALTELNRVVITEENAIKYFGQTDVAGEELTIRVNSQMENYIIDAVVEDLPSNSSLDLQFILPWEKHVAMGGIYKKPWQSIGSTSLVMLRPDSDPTDVGSKINEVRNMLNPGEDGEFARSIVNYLQPFTSIHLSTEIRADSTGLKGGSDPTYSYVLSAIALIILVLACINFANLTVARSLPRSKEIGVRKVLGALKSQLSLQFLSEALYVSIIAFVFGVIMAELFLPVFGELVDKQFNGNVFDDVYLMGSCLVLVVFTALLAGSYPSLVAARFSVIASLNGRIRLSGKRYVSKALVLVQFTIAGVLVVGTIAMNSQIDHMINFDLGYNDQNLATVNIIGRNNNKARLLKNELMSNPKMTQLALMDGYGRGSEFDYDDNKFFAMSTSAENVYFDMIEVPLLAGRTLKENGDQYFRAEDTLSNVLVNEAFLKRIKLDVEEAIGTVIGDGGGKPQSRIVGVLANYRIVSAKWDVSPLVIFPASQNRRMSQLYIKYDPAFHTEIKKEIEGAWRKVDPYQPLSFSFENEKNQNAYKEEQRWKSIITYSTFLAIVISCLGLFGLSHLATQQREKEIGVRKVLGASVRHLVLLLNASFSKLVLLSFIVTIPLAFYLVSNWLDNFTEKIDIGVLLFAIPAVITFSVATLTISVQSFKTATSNPIDSLRNE